MAELLDRHIDPKGTVIVWYAPFERGVNKEIGERLGAYAGQMERINGQVRDLRDIFSKQHYVHPEFRGSTSIKDVMPVLVPELSYDGLAIKEGTMASEQWWAMTAAETEASERAAIADALRAYCKLDSYAMYAIWRKLLPPEGGRSSSRLAAEVNLTVAPADFEGVAIYPRRHRQVRRNHHWRAYHRLQNDPRSPYKALRFKTRDYYDRL